MKKYAVILSIFLILDVALGFCFLPGLIRGEPVAASLLDIEESEPTSYTVTTETAEEILSLADYSSLREIDASQSHEYDALLALRELLPDCEIRWVYPFQGQVYSSDTEALRVSDLSGLETAIRYLPELKAIDLIGTGATVEDLDRFDAIRPGIDYSWSFLLDGVRIRTDIQVYSTQRDGSNYRFTNEDLYPLLKYCRHLRALDLGHNDLTDVSLIGNLNELEVLILADNPIADASPLGQLANLTYLEMPMCSEVPDFGFLDKLTKLRELNICYASSCTRLDFLENMPDFSFGVFKFTNVSQEDYLQWKTRLPDAAMVLWDGEYDSYSSGWRNTERYHQISYAFSHWKNVTLYRGVGDVEYDFNQDNYS